MISNPRILLTNDDGIDAPGLARLKTIADQLSDDVWIVAPAANQSGAGHRFTLGHELKLIEHSENRFSVSGTPADCVVAGCSHILADKRPDIILSGVNQGQNLGDIIHCSGTLAGAREGALSGVLSIALSQGIDYEGEAPVAWDCTEKFGAKVIRDIVQHADGTGAYFNVNFPFCGPDDVSGVQMVPHQRFSRSAFGHYPSHNEGHFFVTIPETPSPIERGYDVHALHFDFAITVTPLTLLHSDQAEIARLQGKFDLKT